jgi:hypothetical protein
MNLDKKKREIAEYKANRVRAATKIQAAYRGYKGRGVARAYIIQRRRKKAKLDNAATRINTVVRCFNARAELRRRRKERLALWVELAGKWKETWSDDARAWFYYNEATGDATWEPVADGYTRADGQLVLANGQTVDFYGVLSGEALQDVDKQKLPLCVECSTRPAIRACNECTDSFCTKCYKETHAIGGRKTHTWQPAGPKDCSECEDLLAEMWCVACDETFCDGCWRKVHSHGKRRYHPFSKVSVSGQVDPRMFTIDGQQVSQWHY